MRFDIGDPGIGTVGRGDLLAAGRELLKRHAVKDLARAIDDAVERLGLYAIADFVVLDALSLRLAAAQVVESGEVNALVDAPVRRCATSVGRLVQYSRRRRRRSTPPKCPARS
jgi:HAMP domain-containing protein